MQPFRPTPHPRPFSPATPDSPVVEKESHIGSEIESRQKREAADEVLREYEENRNLIDKGIDKCAFLIGDLININKDQYTLKYPSSIKAVEGGNGVKRPGLTHHTLSYADEPSHGIDVEIQHTPTGRRTFRRSRTEFGSSTVPTPLSTSLPIGNVAAISEEPEEDFSILRLDLQLGAVHHAKALIHRLEKSSISALIDDRLTGSLGHLGHLRTRVNDPNSRVLVTGDLNAGKSTLVNALLRRGEVMPMDEQPLTTRFVEVVSAEENDGVEEIHILDKDQRYDPLDHTTYTVESLDKLEGLVADMDTDASSPPVRVFLKEAIDIDNPSILHNGVVDISLIDAPGLNRDSIKTTANFARQEEIDVIVFVVSAANHFTLSAKEFIWQASHEKAHLFIVVNRFDQIKDKQRCRRLVLDQIKQLSPKSYEDAADLVHFVDSAKVALGFDEDMDDAFSHLEHSLRSFVLVNRSKSKLGPARNYVTYLLADIELLAAANTMVAEQERDAARDELARVKPVLEKMKKGKDGLEDALVLEEDRVTDNAGSRAKHAMERGLDRLGRGELAAPGPGLELPSYPGVLGVWDYAKETKRVMLASLDFAVSLAEQDAKKLTNEGVERIDSIAEKALPSDVQRTRRVFNPNAMFVAKTARSSRKSSGMPFVGLGLASSGHLAEVSISDILDIQHHVFIARAHLPTSTSRDLVTFSEASSLGAASLAVGALVGGKAMGIRSVVESFVSLSDLASNPAARRWIGPVFGLAALGATAYVVYELPRSIPRNVGRHLQSQLLISSGTEGDAELVPFSEAVSVRISKEVRKVMRIGAGDLKERFRMAVESRAELVMESEALEKKALWAIEQFQSVDDRVEEIRGMVGKVKV